MGRKRTPGLVKRGANWHIDKKIDGIRLSESTGSERLEEAEKYLVRRLETMRQAKIYGVRPKRSFKEAATKFLLENQQKKSIRSDASRLKLLVKFIGEYSVDTIHIGTLEKYVTARQKAGVKSRTINHGLKLVRYILRLAADTWKDEHGLTWLVSAPLIKLLPEKDSRKPYPLNWEEQKTFFNRLPLYLQRMALFKVNTGLRDQEVCKLRWEWEYYIPELDTSVFIIPAKYTKNDIDRLVVLNKIAKQVIEEVRSEHPIYVFTCSHRGLRIINAVEGEVSMKTERHPLYQMNNKSWQKARKETGIPVRVHDLKHTFGKRLRAAGVSFEDRQDLLGHKSKRVTTHYSAAELTNLIEAANKVCVECRGTTITLLKANNVNLSRAEIFDGLKKGAKMSRNSLIYLPKNWWAH